jgi:hypothetical protein
MNDIVTTTADSETSSLRQATIDADVERPPAAVGVTNDSGDARPYSSVERMPQ